MYVYSRLWLCLLVFGLVWFVFGVVYCCFLSSIFLFLFSFFFLFPRCFCLCFLFSRKCDSVGRVLCVCVGMCVHAFSLLLLFCDNRC